MAEAGVVIVGTGLAGYGAAREFRKWDRAAPVTLITSGDGAYYPKPQLSAALAAGKSAGQLAIKDAAAMAAELGATILPFTAVADADAGSRTLALSDGRKLAWSKLVLATGARPRKAAVALADGAVLHSVNGLEEYGALRAAMPAGGRLLILGAGLIGCEFAHDFAASGHKVTVIGNGDAPLSGLLPTRMAAGLRAALESLGVEFRFGDGLAALSGGVSGLEATLASGAALRADAALSAIGFDPDLALARRLGLDCGKGIRVDGSLRASLPGVFALGDCAEMEGRWLPYVAPLNHAAKVVGQTLAGLPARLALPPMPVLIKTPSHPVAVLPPAPGPGGWEEDGDASGIQALYRDADGRLSGFAVSGARYAGRAELLKRFQA